MQININSIVNFLDIASSKVTIHGKISDLDIPKPDSSSKKSHHSNAYDVKISNDSQLIESRKTNTKNTDHKISGQTSKREAWESDSKSMVNSSRYDHHSGEHTIDYMLEMDEPDTFAKCHELHSKAEAAFHKEVNGLIVEDRSFKNKEAWDLFYEEYNLRKDWFERKCMNTGTFVDPISDKANIINGLEKKYSDTHDLSINIYGTDGQDEIDGRQNQFSGASLWRYSTKFNLLMSADMLKQLAEGSDDEKQHLLDILDDSINKLKEVEKNYDGDKIFLRFGVKFHSNGNISYHANYKDCEDPYGIQANSADELLEKLMSD